MVTTHRPRERKLRYQKIEDYIKTMLSSGEFTAGDRIPSERILADELGVNRLTVRKAVTNLVEKGLLQRNGTGGTRVASPSFIRRTDILQSEGISRLIQSYGKSPNHKLLHFELIDANAQLAERMDIREGEKVVAIRRLLSINDQPFCVETSHIPEVLVPGLAAADLMYDQSLYAVLKEKYGITGTVNSDRIISVEAANGVECSTLGMEKEELALCLRLWVRDQTGRIIEYVRSVNNPHIVAFGTGEMASRWK